MVDQNGGRHSRAFQSNSRWRWLTFRPLSWLSYRRVVPTWAAAGAAAVEMIERRLAPLLRPEAGALPGRTRAARVACGRDKVRMQAELGPLWANEPVPVLLHSIITVMFAWRVGLQRRLFNIGICVAPTFPAVTAACRSRSQHLFTTLDTLQQQINRLNTTYCYARIVWRAGTAGCRGQHRKRMARHLLARSGAGCLSANEAPSTTSQALSVTNVNTSSHELQHRHKKVCHSTTCTHFRLSSAGFRQALSQ